MSHRLFSALDHQNYYFFTIPRESTEILAETSIVSDTSKRQAKRELKTRRLQNKRIFRTFNISADIPNFKKAADFLFFQERSTDITFFDIER